VNVDEEQYKPQPTFQSYGKRYNEESSQYVHKTYNQYYQKYPKNDYAAKSDRYRYQDFEPKQYKIYNSGFYESDSRTVHRKTYNDQSSYKYQPSLSSKPYYPKDNYSNYDQKHSSVKAGGQYGMNKSLGVNPEDLFNFKLSPYDEKMNALPSPNIVIATPSSANASATS
jgi:hypothetical protein